MFRTMFCSLAALLLLAGGASAETIFGKVKKAGDGKITVTNIDEKDTTYPVAKDAKVTRPILKGKAVTTEDVAGGLSGVKEGEEVTLTVEKKNGKDTVTKIDLPAETKKKKKKDK